MPEQAPAHLLIVDSDKPLREALRQYLRKHRFLVSLARDPDHARRLLSGLEFDLVLIDGQQPEAWQLCEEIASPVLKLLPKGAPTPGQGEWIAKPFEPRALLGRINTILDRRPAPAPVTPRVLHLGPLRFEVERGALFRQDAPVRLTATEVQLLRILSARPGEPVGRGELVAQLGRKGLATKARAVDVQITRLRRKLEDDPKAPRHLQTVRGAGYMLVAG